MVETPHHDLSTYISRRTKKIVISSEIPMAHVEDWKAIRKTTIDMRTSLTP
jgi:hypothetical protein